MPYSLLLMKKNKSYKILLGFIVVVIISIFVVNTFILPKAIRKQFRHAKIGALELKVDRIKTHFLTQSINLTGVQLSDSIQEFTLNIEKIRFRKIGITTLILNRRIETRRIIIVNPAIMMVKDYKFPSVKKKDRTKTNEPQFLVRNIAVENGRIDVFDSLHNEDSVFSARIGLHIKNLALNPDTAKFLYKNIGLDDLDISVNALHFYTEDDNYRVDGGLIDFNTGDASLSAEDIKVVPLRDRYEVGNKSGFQTDWFDVQVQSFLLQEIDLQKLIADEQFFLHKIEIDGLKAEAFRDVRLPMPDKPDTKLIPDMIASIPYSMHADSLSILNADFRYTERAENSNAAGYVDLNALKVLSENFTNIDSLIASPRELHVQTNLLNSALLNATLTISSKKFPHADRLRGQLKSMPFTAFNTMIEDGMSAKFTGGMVHRMEFDFTYNNNSSNGKLIMDYENLKMELLSRKNQRDKKLKSGVLHSLILRETNLPADKRYREGTIYFERDKKKSTYNFWWKSILSGIKSIVVF